MSIRKPKATLLFLLASTVLYAISGVIDYIFIQQVDLISFYFLWSLGGIVLLPLMARGLKFGPVTNEKIKERLPVIFGSALLVGFNITLFLAYRSFSLAAVYPLIAMSSIVFFFLDIMLFSRFITRSILIPVLSGIIVVIMGVYLVGGGGSLSFDIGMLPYVVAIPFLTGVGYYILSYDVHRYSPGMKAGSMSVIAIITSVPFLIFSSFRIELPTDIAIAASGALYALALFLELKAIGVNEQKVKSKNVAMKNYINNFTYLDTVFVLLGSIAIGSYTLVEVAGGALIVGGVLIVSLSKSR